jgi:hypothetical protein
MGDNITKINLVLRSCLMHPYFDNALTLGFIPYTHFSSIRSMHSCKVSQSLLKLHFCNAMWLFIKFRVSKWWLGGKCNFKIIKNEWCNFKISKQIHFLTTNNYSILSRWKLTLGYCSVLLSTKSTFLKPLGNLSSRQVLECENP